MCSEVIELNLDLVTWMLDKNGLKIHAGVVSMSLIVNFMEGISNFKLSDVFRKEKFCDTLW